MVKNLPAYAGDTGDMGSTPGLGRSPGERNGNPLQFSCLENAMDRVTWPAIVHRVAESDMTELACMSRFECWKSCTLGNLLILGTLGQLVILTKSLALICKIGKLIIFYIMTLV